MIGCWLEVICSPSAASLFVHCSRSDCAQPLEVTASVRPSSASFSCRAATLQSATTPISTDEALYISSASMSIWAMRTPSFRRRPNWYIQLKRAPTISTASAPSIAAERAAPIDIASSSGTVPRPIGDARNGMPRPTSCSRRSPAPDHAAPLPIITSGRFAVASISATCSIAAGSPAGFAIIGADSRIGASASSTFPEMRFPGKSR